MSPRVAMKLIGAGRLALGLGIVAAPAALCRPWVGDVADQGGGQVALRALGARDALLGFMALHVASAQDPMVAARWSSAIALCDVVDGGATVVARGSLPASSAGVTVLALGSAAAGFAISAGLRSA